MQEHMEQGTLKRYAVELLNSSFEVFHRYWFDTYDEMQGFYEMESGWRKPAYIRRIKTITEDE